MILNPLQKCLKPTVFQMSTGGRLLCLENTLWAIKNSDRK